MSFKALQNLRVRRDIAQVCVLYPHRSEDAQCILPFIQYPKVCSRRFVSKRNGILPKRVRYRVLLLHPSYRPPDRVA